MPSTLTRVSYQDLMSEVKRRERSIGPLEYKRNKLLKQLRDIESEIASVRGHKAGAARSAGAKRPKNDMTLTESLAKLLSNKTMSVVDAADAVQKAGYKTSSNSFRTQVNIALINSGKFKRVGRGQYTVK